MAYIDTHALPRNAYAARRAGVPVAQNRPADKSELRRIGTIILTGFVIAANIAVLAAIFPSASDAFSSVTGSVFGQISAPAK
jgi:hypothetical protein